MKLLTVLLALLPLAATACISHDLHVLYGEDEEIARLLEQPPPPDIRTSSIASARRLHQALVQTDGEMTWALLAAKTRRALDSRGALIGTSGRELLDAGTLPTTDGTVLKVRYSTLLFGPQVVDLQAARKQNQTPKRHVLMAKSAKGQITEVVFVLEEDGWKLEKTTF